MFAFGEPWSRVQSRTKLSGRVNSERKLCGEKTSRGKKEGGRGGRRISARGIVTKVLTGSRGRSRERRRQVSRYANFRRTKSIMERGLFLCARPREKKEKAGRWPRRDYRSRLGRLRVIRRPRSSRGISDYRRPPSDYERHLFLSPLFSFLPSYGI